MKKLLLFCALVSGFSITSCKKEQLNNQIVNNNSLKSGQIFTDGKILSFESSEAFYNLMSYDVSKDDNHNPKLGKGYETIASKVDLALKDLKFSSYLDYLKESKSEDFIKDDDLSKILNRDQAIQIGKFIYRINKKEEKVFVLPSQNIDMYDDLVNENLNNKNIKVFSTSDNVVEIMENEGEIEKGIFCSAPIGPFQEAQSPAIVVNQTGAVAYIHNSYQQYGILFKVIGDVYVTATYPPNLKVYVALDNCHWKARCGEDVTGYSHSWMSTEKAQFGTFVTLHRVLLYNGAKRLERYDIRLRGRIEDYDQSSPGQTYTTYFTEWVRVTTY